MLTRSSAVQKGQSWATARGLHWAPVAAEPPDPPSWPPAPSVDSQVSDSHSVPSYTQAEQQLSTDLPASDDIPV